MTCNLDLHYRCCHEKADALAKSIHKYLGAPPEITSAWLDVTRFDCFSAYMAHVRHYAKGASIRQAKKASEFDIEPFAYKNYTPDIHDINHSKPVRSGGEMRGSYLKTLEEMGGPPSKLHAIPMIECNYHWDMMYGVFKPEIGYTQGDVETHQRLVAYISLKRRGDLMMYSQILGHGDFLDKGVMFAMHFHIMEEVLDFKTPIFDSIKGVLYAGWMSGGKGLLQFKKKLMFQPCMLDQIGVSP